MWVVKIGGSLAHSEELPLWLDLLGTHGRGRVVVVPGGGPFADQVRHSQARWGFSDLVAHHMALLAMDQYGRMLAGIGVGLQCAATLSEIREILSDGGVPVWLPSQLVGAATSIPTSWDVTSDSLAAWLSAELRADCLFLLKSLQLSESTISVKSLVDQGRVDPCFPEYMRGASFSIRWLGKQQPYAMTTALRHGQAHGTIVCPVEIEFLEQVS